MYNELDKAVRCDTDACKAKINVVANFLRQSKFEIEPKGWIYEGLGMWSCPECSNKQIRK